VADHMIDARPQTGTAPDERTEMRYPTRASELDHRRLQVPPSPLHDPSSNQLHAGERGERPVVRAVLDRGHQNNPLERLLREIRRRTRVVGAFPDGQSALNLAAARLRHVAGTAWSTKRYLNMELLKDQQLRGANPA
jgi:Transposase, Mutator family